MIKSIRIKNLRSLKDTGYIELRKLNILLGINSSGKSTFLRSFPLFKQSLNKKLRGPISWFDDSLVDFGSYDIAKNKFCDPEEGIEISFLIKDNYKRNYKSMLAFKLSNIEFIPEKEISISYNSDNKGTFINRIKLKIESIEYELYINNRNDTINVFINNTKINIDKWKWDQSTNHNMLPSNEPVKIGDETLDFDNYVYKLTINNILKECNKRLRNYSKILSVINKWTYDKKTYLAYLQNQNEITSLSRRAREWDICNPEFENIYNHISIIALLRILDFTDREVSQFYGNCSYVAPMRAEANRYYRNQGLQVNDIDPYGRNLQEYISSLTSNQSKSYNDFCKNLLNISVYVENSSGHHSIMLKNDNGEFNITDVGFGYSQILPIITKLWFASSNTNYKRYNFIYTSILDGGNIVLMEQPELHLHPALQAKIADAFINVINQKEDVEDYNNSDNKDLRLLIETHSQAIINRIGRRIRETTLSADDVNIILFSKDKDNRNSEVKQVNFNNKGQLEEWPYGFFDPRD